MPKRKASDDSFVQESLSSYKRFKDSSLSNLNTKNNLLDLYTKKNRRRWKLSFSSDIIFPLRKRR